MAFQNRITGAFGAGPFEIENETPRRCRRRPLPRRSLYLGRGSTAAVIITHAVDTRVVFVY